MSSEQFDGMSEEVSIQYQLEQWVVGNPLHNPIRDECCPDFSCCRPELLAPPEFRQRFAEAERSGDRHAVESMLGMALGGLVNDLDEDIHNAGEADKQEH